MTHPALITLQVGFKTQEDPDQVAERIREAIRNIVGRDAVEDFRWRSIPLEPGSPS